MFSPWNVFPQPFQKQRLLGPRPTPPQPEASVAQSTPLQPTQDFAEAFNTMMLMEPSFGGWYMDSGATSHLTSSSGMLHSVDNLNTENSITVGNGSSIPVIKSGSSSLFTPTSSSTSQYSCCSSYNQKPYICASFYSR